MEKIDCLQEVKIADGYYVGQTGKIVGQQTAQQRNASGDYVYGGQDRFMVVFDDPHLRVMSPMPFERHQFKCV